MSDPSNFPDSEPPVGQGGFPGGPAPGQNPTPAPQQQQPYQIPPFIRQLFGRTGQPYPLPSMRPSMMQPWFGGSAPYQPYQMPDYTRPMSEIGGANPDTQRMLDYAKQTGTMGPYAPQSNDMPNIIGNLARYFGRNGSGFVGMPMLGSAKAMLAFWTAYQKGMRQRAQDAHAEMLDKMKLADYNLEKELREYADAWQEYGPHTDEKGNVVAGNSDELHAAMSEIASKYQDQPMLHAINQGDWKSAENLLRGRDNQGQGLKQSIAAITLQLDQAKLRKAQQEQADRDAALEIYKAKPGAGHKSVAPPFDPGPAPSTTPNDPNLFDPSDPNPPRPGQSADDLTPSSTMPADETPSSAARTSAAEPEQPAETADADQAEATPTAAAPAPTTPGAPAKLAEATPPPGISAEQWKAMQGARAQAAPDEEQPGAQFRKPAELAAAQRAAQPDRAQSDVLDKAAAQGWDRDRINADALKIVNGTMKIQEMRAIPKIMQVYAQNRAQEIENAMDAIYLDKNVKGEQVYQELNKINPQFSGVLRQYVLGNLPVPQSAWRNPDYINRIAELGYKADPTFNASTFKIREATKRSFASGVDARNMTSIATLDFHATRMANNMRKLIQMDPGIVREYLGATKLGRDLPSFLSSYRTTQEQRNLFAQIDVDRHTVAVEYERATSGVAPTVSGIHGQESLLDWRLNDEQTVLGALEERQHFAHDRMKNLIDRYGATLGSGARADPLYKLYEGYTRGVYGGAIRPEANARDVSADYPAAQPTPETTAIVNNALRAADRAERYKGWSIQPVQ